MTTPCPFCGHPEHIEDLTIGPSLRYHGIHRCALCDRMFITDDPERPDSDLVSPTPGPGDLSSVRLRRADGTVSSGAWAVWHFELGHGRTKVQGIISEGRFTDLRGPPEFRRLRMFREEPPYGDDIATWEYLGARQVPIRKGAE